MTQTITGRFDVTSWDEEVYDDADGVALAQTSSTKAFEGGIVGTSTVRILQAGAPDGAAAYVAVERVTGEVDGRKGTFVLTHRAVMSPAGGEMTIAVLPHSATGDLAGLTGEMTIGAEHAYTFVYSLESQ
jgi:hypothetical protein